MEGERLTRISVDFHVKKYKDKEKERERVVTRREAGLSSLEVAETHPNLLKMRIKNAACHISKQRMLQTSAISHCSPPNCAPCRDPGWRRAGC